MSKTSSKQTPYRITLILLAAALGFSTLALSAKSLLASQTAVKPATPKPYIGEFNLRSFESVQSDYNSKTGTNIFTLERPDLVSPRYDFSGARVQLTVEKGRAQNGVANGNVRVTVRDKAVDGSNKQTIAAACDQARYRAGSKPNEGHIDLTGNIVFKVFTPDVAGPLVLTGQTGTIDLLGNNLSRYRINKGSATTTPIEPTPAPKKP